MANVPDLAWTPLRAAILSIPGPRLFLIPSLAGSVWFVTLAGLLLTWIARGMPRYPGQRNPDVAFISEIAAFELKSFFLVGASITALCFVLTIATVHVLRYEPGVVRRESDGPVNSHPGSHPEEGRAAPGLPPAAPDDTISTPYDDDSVPKTKTLKCISLLSLLAASTAAVAIVLFGLLDTFRFPHAHELILRVYLTALALQAAGTAVVFADEVVAVVLYLGHGGRGSSGLRVTRVSPFLSTALVLLELALAVASVSLTIPGSAHYLAAGVLEWVVAFSGTAYLWLFCGFLRWPRTTKPGDAPGRRRKANGVFYQRAAERVPLLGD